MPVTKTRVVLDSEGNVAMIVFPDWDEQLLDPAFSPEGLTCVDVPKQGYDNCKCQIDFWVLLQNHIPGNAFEVRKAVSGKIRQINDDAAAAAQNAPPTDPTLDPGAR